MFFKSRKEDASARIRPAALENRTTSAADPADSGGLRLLQGSRLPSGLVRRETYNSIQRDARAHFATSSAAMSSRPSADGGDRPVHAAGHFLSENG